MKSSRVVFSGAARVGGSAAVFGEWAFGIGGRVLALSGNGHGASRRGGGFPFARYKKMNVVMARRALASKWNSQNEE